MLNNKLTKGSFGVCLYEPKNVKNLGMLARSAYCFGASFIATIHNRYKRDAADTIKVEAQLPIFHFDNFGEFLKNKPQNMSLVGLEVCNSQNLERFCHPRNGLYIFGGENKTLPEEVLTNCKFRIKINTIQCLNLAVCGSIVMFDRNRQFAN